MSQFLPTHTITLTDVVTGESSTEAVYTITNMEMVRALLGLDVEPVFCAVCAVPLTQAQVEDSARPFGYCSTSCADMESAEMEREANAVDL